MSLLSRAGSSVQRNVVSRVGPSQVSVRAEFLRFKSGQEQPPAASQPGYIAKRKGKGIESKWRKAFPQFRSLPPHQLNNEIYTGTEELDLPGFRDSVGRNSDWIGKPVKLVPAENDPLRVFGLPKNLLLEFRLLSKPYTVIRQVTKQALDMLERAKDTSSLEDRWVFTGQPGCGKSFLLLQVIEHAIQHNWVVIYIPRAVDLVNSTTSYAYDSRTRTYLQPSFSFQTLQRMLTVNKKAFENIYLPKDLVLEKQVIPAGTNLATSINSAIQERSKSKSVTSSPAILEGVMRALDSQTTYPVLFAVDQFQALYGKTSYHDQHFVPIHSYHLSMPRLIMDYGSGRRSFARGAFLGAICATQSTNPLPIELRDALELDELDTRTITDYDKRNQTMIGYTNGLKKFSVPEKLTLEEAVGVFEIWKGMKVFGSDQTFYDETFLGKYTESGGNPRDFVWNGLLSSFEA